MTGDSGAGGRGRRLPGSAAGKLVMRPDFDDPLPEGLQAAFEGGDPVEVAGHTKHVIVELGEGGRVNRTQVPEGVELVILDADAYLEPSADSTRSDLKPYERCGACGEARMVHRDNSGSVLWEHVRCDAFESTRETLGGDPLPDWEDR